MSGLRTQYLTTDEAARALGVSRRTLARYKSDHRITPVRADGKDLYSLDELARFNASSETPLDKLTKQHLFNSARIVELEARLNLLESMLGISAKRTLLKISDVDVKGIQNTLEYLCGLSVEQWTTDKVEDLANDVSRMGDRLIKKIGKAAKIALELGYIHASSSSEPRAKIAEALARQQLDRVMRALG